MKRIVMIGCALLACATAVAATKPEKPALGDEKSLYDLLDLERPELKNVKRAVEKGNIPAADKELLKYFRSRKPVQLFGLDLENIKVSKLEQRQADEALEHKFYAHKGYQPSYFYGDDIDWRYWPVRDNELRWQLHRHYWFIPLAKCYYLTRDNRYIDAWIDQYSDWVKKNPLDGVEKLEAAGASQAEIEAERENVRFAWRPMEAGRRLQDLLTEFALTIQSLRTYRQHADHILHNYSKQGNHLLFEAQRMLFAGIYFPEFREAPEWRRSGIEILNREIGVQVYPDGMQFELDFGYHIAAIDIFLKALGMARQNGFETEFPASYIETVGKMTAVTWNLLFPDYSNPMFGDTKSHDKTSLKKQFRNWSRVFPDDRQLQWFASEGRKGALPEYTSQQFPASGFYALRTGWDKDATVTVVKAGPPAFWHNQPDNGTFEYWHRGRNFFPDSGSYVYGGDSAVLAQRNWFRQTRVHNTLTLDNRNLDSTDSKLLLWKASPEETVLVTENPSYEGLVHRRAMFFLKDGLLVIVDRASGAAAGTVGVHFNLCPGPIEFAKDGTLRTLFDDGNNIRIKSKGCKSVRIQQEEGWVSNAYRKKEERPAYAVEMPKETGEEIWIVSVIAPEDKERKGSIAIVPDPANTGDRFRAALRVGGKTYDLKYDL